MDFHLQAKNLPGQIFPEMRRRINNLMNDLKDLLVEEKEFDIILQKRTNTFLGIFRKSKKWGDAFQLLLKYSINCISYELEKQRIFEDIEIREDYYTNMNIPEYKVQLMKIIFDNYLRTDLALIIDWIYKMDPMRFIQDLISWQSGEAERAYMVKNVKYCIKCSNLVVPDKEGLCPICDNMIRIE